MPFRVVYRGTQTHSFGWVIAFSKPLRAVPAGRSFLLRIRHGGLFSLSTNSQWMFCQRDINCIVPLQKNFHKISKINSVAKVLFIRLPVILQSRQKFQTFFQEPVGSQPIF